MKTSLKRINHYNLKEDVNIKLRHIRTEPGHSADRKKHAPADARRYLLLSKTKGQWGSNPSDGNRQAEAATDHS